MKTACIRSAGLVVLKNLCGFSFAQFNAQLLPSIPHVQISERYLHDDPQICYDRDLRVNGKQKKNHRQ